MRRHRSLLLLGIAASIGVLWILVDRTRRKDEPRVATGTSAPSTEDDASPPGALVDDARADDRARRELATIEDPPSAVVPSPAEPLDDRFAIRVVLASTGASVPGAEVRILDRRHLDAHGHFLAEMLDDDQPLIDRYARRARADEHGIVLWPRAGLLDGTVATAEHEGLRGRCHLAEGSPDEVVLALAADADVRVRVLDAAHAPVPGVEVFLLARDGSRARTLAVAASGADGVATLLHVRSRFIEQDDAQPRVGVAGIFVEPVEAPLDLADLPAEPIELVLPPAGGVEVLVERADGERAGETCVVKLERPRAAGHLGTPGFWGSEFSRTLFRIAENGRSRFEPVGLGLELIASAVESGFEAVEQRVSGPTMAGESVSVRLALGRPTPVVVGRVLDPTGTPVASASLGVFLVSRFEAASGSAYDRVGTDAGGEFRFPLPTDHARPSTWELALTLDPDEGPRLSATVELPGDLPPGDNHVGDLVLVQTPLLVAGIVVDEEDRPIADASIDCSLRYWEDHTRRGYSLSSLMDAEGRTRSDGSFAIWARSPHAEVFLAVRHADFLSVKDLETYAGADNLRIVLAGPGTVEGTVLLDDEIESTEGLGLLLRSSAIEPGDSPRGEFDERTFRFGGVPSGTYAFECHFWPEQREIARVEGVVVAAGVTTRDPRLDPLDLRGLLRHIRIRVVDEDGRALPAVGVSRRLEGDPDFHWTQWEQAGKETVRITTLAERLDLRVEAIGKRTVELLGVDGDREVVLGPGLAVRVVLAGEELTLPEGVTAKLSLRPEPFQSGAVAVFEARLDARGGADLLVGRPGLYRLRVLLETPGGAVAGLKGGDELVVDVLASSEGGELPVKIDPATWREALARLGFE